MATKGFSFKWLVIHYLRIALAALARAFYSFYYYNKSVRIPPITDDILMQPAVEVARRIRNKEISSVAVLETCIRRIKDINPALNCFVEDRFKLAMIEAKEADEQLKNNSMTAEQLEKHKPFLGVPFTTKDCIAVKGLHHTAGVVLRKDTIAIEDADCIKLLRESGAIIIGLTNVPELCMWWESFNKIHGRTNNPYNTTRIVGGSSGGEGCIQGAAGSIFGVGSDIGGSIRMPAFFNGIFGHKPTKFIVSNDGQYPNPETELQAYLLGLGPMTRHAIDLKPLLKIMSGKNSNKLDLDKPVDISKLKVIYQYSNNAPVTDAVDPEILAAMVKALDHIQTKFNIKAEEKSIPLLQESLPIWFMSMKGDSIVSMITEKDGIGVVIKEIFKTMFGCSRNTFVGLITALNDLITPEKGSQHHQHYCKLRDELEQSFKDMLGDNGVFFFPTHPTPAPYHNEPLFKSYNFSYTSIINCLGMPATHIPLGLNSEGLPIGIQVVANHNNDRLCLAIAEELGKTFGGWIEPK